MNPFVFKWLKLSLVSLVVCTFLALAVYALLKSDEIRSAQIEPPLISLPEDQPLKTRPEEPGGLDFPNQDKLVFDLLESTDAPAEVAPTVASSTVAASSFASSDMNVQLVSESAVSGSTVLPVEAVAPPQQMAQVQPVAAAAAPAVQAKPEAKPAAKPQPKPEASPAKGAWAVQLAAVNTEADARKTGAQLQAKFSALKGLTLRIVPVPEASRFRIQFAGLASRAEAQKVCGSLGSQPCFPVGK